MSTFLVGVFKADDLGDSAIFSQQCDMLFWGLKLNKRLFTSFFDMGKWIKPSLSKYTTLFLSCNHAEKKGFQRGIPKMTTTEACDETAQHVNYYKLLSFCDKRVRGRKEIIYKKGHNPS